MTLTQDILLAINAGLGSQPTLIVLGDLRLPTVFLGLNSLRMKPDGMGEQRMN